jgi:hypothetical protein
VGGSALSSIDWWRQDPGRVGTAYIVERDGTVYEVFPADAWAVHLFRLNALPAGLTSSVALAMERRTIGIELASEGALEEKAGDLWAFGTGTGKKLGRADALLAAGKVVRFPTPWRDVTYFDAYDELQVAATIALAVELCDRFAIPRALHPSWPTGEAHPDRWSEFRGVLTHAMLRPDKTDVHLGFPFERLKLALAGA